MLPKNGWQIWHRFPVSSLDYRLLFDVRRRNSTPLDDSNEKKTIKTKRRSERRLGPSIDGAPHSDAGAAEKKKQEHEKQMPINMRPHRTRTGRKLLRAARERDAIAKINSITIRNWLVKIVALLFRLVDPAGPFRSVRDGDDASFACSFACRHRPSTFPLTSAGLPFFSLTLFGFFSFFFCCSSFCVPVVSISAPECSECRCSRMRKRNRDFTAVCVRKVTQIRSPPPAPETFFHSLKTGLSRT